MAKDTLTAQFTIEGDFETIQAIRRHLADPAIRAALRSRLSDTLHTFLAGQIGGEYVIDAALKVSQERQTRAGSRLSIPTVKNGELSWHDAYADRVNVVCRVDSPDWFIWLGGETHTSFNYTGEGGQTFTAIRRKDGVWYAHKRIGGKLRRRYLGGLDKVTRAKLEQVAVSLRSDTKKDELKQPIEERT